MKLAFISLLLCSVSVGYSQNQFHLSYGFGGINRLDAFSNSIISEQQTEVLGEDPDKHDHAPIVHRFGFTYNRKINTWLGAVAGINYDYARHENSTRTSALSSDRADGYIRRFHNYAYDIYGIRVGAEIDLLWKNPDDALLIYFGSSLSYISRSEDFIIQIDTANDPYQHLALSRRGYSISTYFGIAWEEYLTERWGYRIFIDAHPTYNFIPKKLIVTKDIYDYQERNTREYTYQNSPADISKSELVKERIRSQALYLGIAICYRL